MSKQARRTNAHRSRKGTHGKPCTAVHNSRNFDTTKADHIDEQAIKQNVYWQMRQGELCRIKNDVTVNFEEFEQRYYEENFSEQLEQRNQKQIKGRHKERVQTMEQFRKSIRYCPEEVIFTIGNHNNQTDPNLMQKIFEDYVKWHNAEFPNAPIIDAALHLDEPDASPHIHARQVWFTGKEHKEIGQEKALTAMKIQRPDTTKPVSRYNNAKMTYTELCRKKQIEIARSYGIEIIDEPKDPSESGKNLLKLKADTAREQAEQQEERLKNATEQAEEVEQQIADYQIPPPPTVRKKPNRPRISESKKDYVNRLIKEYVEDKMLGHSPKDMAETARKRKEYGEEWEENQREWNNYDNDCKAYEEWEQSAPVLKAMKSLIENKQKVAERERMVSINEEQQRKARSDAYDRGRARGKAEEQEKAKKAREEEIAALQRQIEQQDKDIEFLRSFLARHGLDIDDVIDNEEEMQRNEGKNRRKKAGYEDYE